MKNILLSLCCSWLCCTLILAQQPWTGSYTGVAFGVDVLVALQQNGTQLSGTYQDSGSSSTLLGTIGHDNIATGTMTSEGIELATFTAHLQGTALAMDVNLLGLLPVSLSLTKTATTATPNLPTNPSTPITSNNNSTNNTSPSPTNSSIDNKTRDPKLLGTWVRESIINSGGYGNAASFSTAYYLSFFANGKSIEESESAGGGGDWSYDGGGRSLEFEGYWYSDNGSLYFRPTNSQTYILYAKYLFHDGNLVLTNINSGKREIYHR